MNHTVTFTHLITGKNVTLARDSNTNRFPVVALIHGPAKDPRTGKESPDENVWLVLESVPNAIPIRETEEEALALLELNNKE